MRELSNNELELTVGGAMASGWVPANYRGVAIHEEIRRSFAAGRVRIPGLIPGPVFMPGPPVYRSGTTLGVDRTSEC